MYPRPGSNRHAFKGQGILSPSCLPIPPLRHLHKKSRLPSGPCGAENETRTRDPDLGKVVLYQLSYFRFANCAAKVQLFSIPQAILRKKFHFSFFNTIFQECIMNFFLNNSRLIDEFFRCKSTIQQLLNLIQLHQSLDRGQSVNVGIKNVLLNLQKQWVVQLDKA